MPFEAVLFDFDGVLADTEPLHWSSWNAVLKPLGISISWEDYSKHCIGIPDPEAAAFFAALRTPPARFEEVWSRYPEKSALFAARIASGDAIPESIRKLLDRLRHTHRLGLVTATERKLLEPALEASGIRRFFDVVVGAEDVSSTKPHPEPYLLARQKLKIRSGLAVEDSDAGEASARAAGLEVIRVEHPSETHRAVLAALGLAE